MPSLWRVFILLAVAVQLFGGGGAGAEGPLPTPEAPMVRVVIGQNAELVCYTKSEEMRWTIDGKNITKGSNKRCVVGVGGRDPFFLSH